jgi:hypothetical protein
MECEKIINIGPICRFGPGGEYVTNWPFFADATKGRSARGELACPELACGELVEPVEGVESVEWEDPTSPPQGVLTKLLNMLAGMIEALRGNMSEQGMFYYVSKDRSIEQPRRTYASAGSVIKHNRWLCDQPGLFADDWRAGANVKHKPNHGIRARRATAKKGTCFTPAEGLTLFDADSKSAKTA